MAHITDTKSWQAYSKASDKADNLRERGERLIAKGHPQGGHFLDKANRYGDAAAYLEKRVDRIQKAAKEHEAAHWGKGEGNKHGDVK